MMSCGRIQRTIQAYVDGGANSAQRQAVELHVADCAECSRVLAQSRKLVDLLGAVPERRVSEAFERNLAMALRETKPDCNGAAWWERFRLHFEWRLRVPALVTAGSLAAALVAAVVAPPYVEQHEMAREQERLQERLVVSAVERHQQLERANTDSNWEAIDGSIDLTTGSILTE